MGGPPNSQTAPLPSNLPFRLVSKTIGCGAYASVRKAIPPHTSGPVIAVKFINKEHAFRSGKLRPKQLLIELSLHKSVCPHQNIIRYLSHGEDPAWVWMALELAEGGDLFDKIEADEGVGEDVAHFYFTQLVSAIGWCHGKGVAHRDIKPENMLLSGGGDLKLADFGLATQFLEPRTGNRKYCGMVCGSPPYIAPEIIAVGHANQKRKSGEEKVLYDPQIADVWSCAIVLFVLLAGNTPWDAPVMDDSYEFHEYVKSNGRPDDELWNNIPNAALSLVRGMLNIEHTERMTLDSVRKHPWFTRPNTHLSKQGKAADPMALATQMLKALHIDFSTPDRGTQSQGDPMDIDGSANTGASLPSWKTNFTFTQPDTPIADTLFDWEEEAPPRLGGGLSASQPQTKSDRHDAAESRGMHGLTSAAQAKAHLLRMFADEPSMSQFSATPSVPLTLTQAARRFNDILPSHSLARFFSALPHAQLLPMLIDALHRVNVSVLPPSPAALQGRVARVVLKIKTLDVRHEPLLGKAVVERVDVHGLEAAALLQVKLDRTKGDPIGWRRLFKSVAKLCKDAVLAPEQLEM